MDAAAADNCDFGDFGTSPVEMTLEDAARNLSAASEPKSGEIKVPLEPSSDSEKSAESSSDSETPPAPKLIKHSSAVEKETTVPVEPPPIGFAVKCADSKA